MGKLTPCSFWCQEYESTLQMCYVHVCVSDTLSLERYGRRTGLWGVRTETQKPKVKHPKRAANLLTEIQRPEGTSPEPLSLLLRKDSQKPGDLVQSLQEA